MGKNNYKTRTSKVGAISKAQKAQNIIFGKNLKFSKIFLFRKMSHSAEKNQKGDPLVSAGFVGSVKKVKNERRDPLETKKIKKSRTVPKKSKRGDPLVSAGFVGYVKKSKK